MNPAIAALLAIPEKPIPGAALLAGLYEEAPVGVEELLEMQYDIQDQLGEARALAKRSQEVVQRCLRLKPVPTPQVPPGF